jgi:hypothetical protein
MKKLIIATLALITAVVGVVAIADYQMKKEDQAFVASGGKIKGCDSLKYENGIICIKNEFIAKH